MKLLDRYASRIPAILTAEGIRHSDESTLGDTVTADKDGVKIVDILLQAGAVLIDYNDLPNRLYVVVKLDEKFLSVKWQKTAVVTLIVHWHPSAKLEKRRVHDANP